MSATENRHKFWMRRWKCLTCKHQKRYAFDSPWSHDDLKEVLFEKASEDHQIKLGDSLRVCNEPKIVIEIRDIFIQTGIPEEKGKHGTT
jgi:hypothetical protein